MTLTTAGRQFAEREAHRSILARVALRGHDGEWPETYVDTAIRTCNQAGAHSGRSTARGAI